MVCRCTTVSQRRNAFASLPPGGQYEHRHALKQSHWHCHNEGEADSFNDSSCMCQTAFDAPHQGQ